MQCFNRFLSRIWLTLILQKLKVINDKFDLNSVKYLKNGKNIEQFWSNHISPSFRINSIQLFWILCHLEHWITILYEIKHKHKLGKLWSVAFNARSAEQASFREQLLPICPWAQNLIAMTLHRTDGIVHVFSFGVPLIHWPQNRFSSKTHPRVQTKHDRSLNNSCSNNKFHFFLELGPFDVSKIWDIWIKTKERAQLWARLYF